MKLFSKVIQFSQIILCNNARIMQMLLNLSYLRGKITKSECQWNRIYTHKLYCYIENIWNLLQHIRTINEAKFKFQDQSSRSQCWFDLDFDWIEVNFSTRETDWYKKPFQNRDDTQYINTHKSFQVPIGNPKSVESFKFQNDAPILKYFQKSLNSCRLSSLVSDFSSIDQN